MGYWNDGDLVLGDAPANAISAAWRRILVPREADGRGPPRLAEALTAFTASLQRAACWPPVASLAVCRAGEPTLEVLGTEADAELVSSFDDAIVASDRAYRQSLGRRASTEELVAMLDFVVRPAPATFFADADATLGERWDLRATIARGPVRCDAGVVVVGVTAAQVVRRLVEDAGGRVLHRVAHDVPNRAIELAERRCELDACVEALTVVQAPVVSADGAPNTYVIRRGTIPASGLEERVRALSGEFGTWAIGCDATTGAPQVIGAHLGCPVGGTPVPTEEAAWDELVRLGDRLGFVTSSLWSSASWAHVETLFLRAAPPRDVAPTTGSRLGAILAPRIVVRRALRGSGGAFAGELLERASGLAGEDCSLTLVRGEFDEEQWLAAARGLDRSALVVRLGTDGVARHTALDGAGVRHGIAQGIAELVESWSGLTIQIGDPPGSIRWPTERRGHTMLDDDPPGLFAPLVEAGLVPREAIDALLESLPPTWIHGERGSERLDSTRWPCRRDAELASAAARALSDPSGHLSEVATALERAQGDLSALRKIRNDAAQRFDDALLDDEGDLVLAQAAHDLAVAHVAAYEGLEAYHVHRRLPGIGASAAASVVRLALARGAIDAQGIVAAASERVRAPLEPPPWFWELIDDAAGDRERLRARLAECGRERLVAFYVIHRDLATALTSAAHLARMPAGTSDPTAFETAAWVVTCGRQRYRATAHDPALMPSTARPGTASARAMIDVAAEVWADRFGDERFPTDAAIDWASVHAR